MRFFYCSISISPCLFVATALSAHSLHHQVPLTTMSSQVITDALPAHHSIQIFTSLVRDVESVSTLLSSSRHNCTVLAPTNTAMSALSHKPWEDPEEYKEFGANVYEGQAGQDRAQKNIQRFVEAHVVPKAPWAESDKVKTIAAAEGQDGKAIWWEDAGNGNKKLAPDGVSVDSVAASVSNGEVWIVNGVLKS